MSSGGKHTTKITAAAHGREREAEKRKVNSSKCDSTKGVSLSLSLSVDELHYHFWQLANLEIRERERGWKAPWYLRWDFSPPPHSSSPSRESTKVHVLSGANPFLYRGDSQEEQSGRDIIRSYPLSLCEMPRRFIRPWGISTLSLSLSLVFPLSLLV